MASKNVVSDTQFEHTATPELSCAELVGPPALAAALLPLVLVPPPPLLLRLLLVLPLRRLHLLAAAPLRQDVLAKHLQARNALDLNKVAHL